MLHTIRNVFLLTLLFSFLSILPAHSGEVNLASRVGAPMFWWIPPYADTYSDEQTWHPSPAWGRAHSPKSLMTYGDRLIMHPDPMHMISPEGHVDGTPLVYRDDSPEHFTLVYDRVHRIAIYSRGCCSWGESVAVADVSPPPGPIEVADLSKIQSRHGIALGDSPQRVKSILGWAMPLAAKGDKALMRLSYGTPVDSKTITCGLNDEYIFRKNRLIAMIFVWAC